MIIIDQTMIDRAINLIEPTAQAIFATRDLVWGPPWVHGAISVPNIPEDLLFRFGDPNPWNPEWGEIRDFAEVAKRKLELAKRLKMNTSVAINLYPWLLKEGEYLYPGGVYRDGIACGVSGAKGWVDECLAEMVVSAIIVFAHIKTDICKEAKVMKI